MNSEVRNVPTPLDIAVFVLSISCGVLGVALLSHRGVRMMRGGLLHTLAVGLAVIGIALTLGSVSAIYPAVPVLVPQVFQIVVLVVLYYVAYAVWITASKMESGA